MGRLANLRPTLGALAPRLKRRTDAEGHSRVAEPWRKWFDLKAWKRLRWATFVRDHFTCQCGCGHVEPNTSQLVGDHIKPHRGDPALFWDPDNVQTLFKPCHDAKKQREERAAPWRQAKGG